MVAEDIPFATGTRVRVLVRRIERTNLHLHPNALEVVYVLRGALHVRVSSEDFDLDAGDYVVINRGDPHMLAGSVDTVTAVLYFDLAAYRGVDPFVETIVFACESFDLARYRRQEALLRGMLLDLVHDDLLGSASGERLDAQGAELIRILCAGYSLEGYYNRDGAVRVAQREKFLAVHAFLRANLGRRDALDAVAREYHYSKSYVSHLVKDVAAVSFSDLLTALRLMPAEVLLLTTEDTVLDISATCGFSDVKYFTRSFADWFKQSPTEYRARYRPEVQRDNQVHPVDAGEALALVYDHRQRVASPAESPRLSITPLLLKNVGSRFDLFDALHIRGARDDARRTARRGVEPGPPHLVPIRISAADLDGGYLLDGLASFAQINATPCVVLEYTTKSATTTLMAGLARRLPAIDIGRVAVWLVYRGVGERDDVNHVIDVAETQHGVTVQAILMP